MMTYKSNISERGFVLPYVLVVIAILAIIGTIAAERLQRSSDVIAQIQEQADINLAFMNAESEAIFTLLSAINVKGGFNLDQNAIIETDFGFINAQGNLIQAQQDNIPAPDLWSVKGGQRRANTTTRPIRLEVWDTASLVSLNTAPQEVIEKILIASGASTTQARTLSARLIDYRDSDASRQFRGAERADYRLRKKPIPSNAPFRSFRELTAILGWSHLAQNIDMIDLMNMTTLDQRTSLVRHSLASPRVLNALDIDIETIQTPQRVSLDDIGAGGTTPTNSARLILSAPRPSGGTEVRVIELIRQTGHLNKPFRRLWVYETTVLEERADGLTPALNELKHVIKTPSVLPQ